MITANLGSQSRQPIVIMKGFRGRPLASEFLSKICLNEVALISLITSSGYTFSYQSESPFLILFIWRIQSLFPISPKAVIASGCSPIKANQRSILSGSWYRPYKQSVFGWLPKILLMLAEWSRRASLTSLREPTPWSRPLWRLIEYKSVFYFGDCEKMKDSLRSSISSKVFVLIIPLVAPLMYSEIDVLLSNYGFSRMSLYLRTAICLAWFGCILTTLFPIKESKTLNPATWNSVKMAGLASGSNL